MPSLIERAAYWLREVLDKMLTQNDIRRVTGIPVMMSSPMVTALRTWAQLYENKPEWALAGKLKSMNLPAAIAGEISRATTIEMKARVEGSPRAEFLNEQIQAVIPRLRQQVEYAAAKGGLMFKPYVFNGKVIVDYIQADQFYPVAFDASGNITACVFSDQRAIGDKWFTRLEFHQMVEEGCKVINSAFRSSTKEALGNPVPLSAVREWADLQPEATVAAVTRPLYGYLKFPAANNIDPASPLGVSCYARVIDLIKQVDQQWTDFLWEFESGRRALFVDEQALERGTDGLPKLPAIQLYRTLSMSGEIGGKELFEEWSPKLREANLLTGLDAMLRRIEFNVGLAYGTLSNPQTIDKTATELKIAQQRSYSTITDTQKALTKALEDLLYAMDVWATIYNLAPKGQYALTADYDDSILVDKDQAFQQDLRLVTTNIMSKLEFRMRNFKEDEATARLRLSEVSNEMAAEAAALGSQMGFGSPTKSSGGGEA